MATGKVKPKTRVRTRPAQPEPDELLDSVRDVVNMPLAAYRTRTVDPDAPLMAQCPLFFAELAEVKRTKVYRD